MKPNKRWFVACVTTVSVFALVAVAMGAGTPDRSKQADRLSYTERSGYRSPFSSLSDPSEIATSVLHTYGGNHVRHVNVRDAPRNLGQRPGAWVDLVLDVPGEGAQTMRPQWEADLVQGAIAEALEAGARAIRVVGSTFVGRLPDGSNSRDLAGGGMGDITPGQDFMTAPDSEIERTLTQGLAAADLKPVAITVLHAAQPAPAVVASTDHPAAAARAASETIRALFGQTPKYEGYYFEVRGRDGRPLLVQSASFRTGAGRLWIDPSLDAVSSLNHGIPRM